jgi:hypothetical protein
VFTLYRGPYSLSNGEIGTFTLFDEGVGNNVGDDSGFGFPEIPADRTFGVFIQQGTAQVSVTITSVSGTSATGTGTILLSDGTTGKITITERFTNQDLPRRHHPG